MIVKLVLHEDQKSFSIWNKEGERLYYSDQPKDVELCKQLLTIRHAPVAPAIEPTYSLANKSYFMAKWVKGIVTMTKRVSGYSW